jgi:hypothetical protein
MPPSSFTRGTLGVLLFGVWTIRGADGEPGQQESGRIKHFPRFRRWLVLRSRSLLSTTSAFSASQQGVRTPDMKPTSLEGQRTSDAYTLSIQEPEDFMTSCFVRINTVLHPPSGEPGIHALRQGGEARASSARNKAPATRVEKDPLAAARCSLDRVKK